MMDAGKQKSTYISRCCRGAPGIDCSKLPDTMPFSGLSSEIPAAWCVGPNKSLSKKIKVNVLFI